jgi:hypothetical protein
VGQIGECEQQGLGEVGLVMAGKDGVVVGCSSGKSCSNRRWLSGGEGGCGGGDWPFGGEGDRDLRGFEGFDVLGNLLCPSLSMLNAWELSVGSLCHNQ